VGAIPALPPICAHLDDLRKFVPSERFNQLNEAQHRIARQFADWQAGIAFEAARSNGIKKLQTTHVPKRSVNYETGANMFTIDAIHEAFKQVKSGEDFPQFVQDLKSLGVTHYDNYVADGRTQYYGPNGYTVHGEAKYPDIAVNPRSSAEKLKHAIAIHQQGQTDYPTFCLQAADAGVEKWTTHMIAMTVTYLDNQGHTLTVEPIPHP